MKAQPQPWVFVDENPLVLKGRRNAAIAQLHLIFSTKERRPFLKDPGLRHNLHAYMAGILQDEDCPAILINSVEDHVHALFHLSRTVAIATIVQRIKASSSKWLKERSPEFAAFQWQSGYGVFSVSRSRLERVRVYVANQEEHHRTMTYQDELRELLRKHGIEFDERYLWD
ncbi:MAG: IS200/IS605 family transposase [Pirellulales bacterium]